MAQVGRIVARHLPDAWLELTDPTLPVTMPGRQRGDVKEPADGRLQPTGDV